MAPKKRRAPHDKTAPGGPASALEAYRRKRSADRTAEPFGTAVPRVAGPEGAALFVVQKHAARRLHWDLRLEIDGVLRSWAVPRGPCLDPSVKRLAVQTEDHPIEYVDFEGIIPAGNYGAGAMIVWDRGVWIPLEPVAEGYAAGKLLFELQGHKLRGIWTLVRTKEKKSEGKGRQWLLIKKPDGASTTDAPPYDETSILSGLTIEELREGADRSAELEARLVQLGAPQQPVDPARARLMLAETVDEAFSDPRWIFELKYDGYRLLAAKEGGTVSLRYRSGIDATLGFPEIARALSALPFETFVLDGEVVVLDPDARPNFQRLQKRAMLLRSRDIERAAREHPVTLYAFDLLGFATYDVRGLPLLQRKELLRRMLPSTGPVRFADSIPEQGEMLMQEVTRLGIEGIVAKRADTPYVAGRTPHWRKIRVERTDDFVIVGFTEPENTRLGIGALQLATHVGETLTYVGKVGTGFSDRQLVELRAELDGRVRAKPPCAGAVPKGARNVWVEPELVCEVRFKQLTDDLLLRQSVFLRMRDDKSPTECVLLGHDEPPSESESESESKTDAAPTPTPSAAPTHHRRVVISNPDKVFWPAEGYTKLDLIEFYRDISPWLLPYLRDRPLVLTRYPDGIEGKNFFQKNAPPYLPPWVRTQTMWSEHAGREIEYFVCDDVDALTYVANLATIPLHVWGSRLTDLQHPDWCILDLDPKGAPFSDVVTIARHIHALCQEIDLPAYVKTSGSTGLHVLVPLGALCTFEQCRMLAEVLARVTASRLRDIATVERAMRARQGRVYIDYLQNGHGRLLVSPYCVRPLAGAPVSMPLAWDEVGPELDMGAFTIRTVPQIMQARGHDPMSPVLHEKPDLQHALAALLERLET